MDSVVQFNTEKTSIKKVYYTGTDVLYGGYALCYDADTLERQGDDDTTAALVNEQRATRVEKPAAANINYFAGVVAEKSSGLTGPCFITILLPTAHGTSVNVWTNASTTAVSTKLYLTIGSYALTTSGPVLVAEALQTIDRSTVNGRVQAFLSAPTVANPANQEVGSSDTFTDAIWRNFPLNNLRQNPNLGTFHEYDPAYNPTASLPPYSEFTGAANSVAVIAGVTLAEAKQLVLAQEAATDNNAVAIQFPGPITTTGAKAWAFEVEYDLVSVTNADMESFVGLFTAATLSNVIPYQDGGAFTAASNMLGFNVVVGDGNAINVSYQAGGETTVVHDTGPGVPAANTAITVAMYYDGATVAVYINGTLITDPILATDIVDTTDIFPEAVACLMTVASKGDSTVADGDDLNVRAFRYAQLS